MSIFHLGQHHEVYNAADIGEFDVSAFCIDVEQAGDVAHVLAHCRREDGGHLLTKGFYSRRIFCRRGCIFDAPRGPGVHFLTKASHFRRTFCRRGPFLAPHSERRDGNEPLKDTKRRFE